MQDKAIDAESVEFTPDTLKTLIGELKDALAAKPEPADKQQKQIKELEKHREKLGEHDGQLEQISERNSMSKTDHDATFMRMTEDATLECRLYCSGHRTFMNRIFSLTQNNFGWLLIMIFLAEVSAKAIADWGKMRKFASHYHKSPYQRCFHKTLKSKNHQNKMKKDLHPSNYREVVFKDMSNEEIFITRSTVAAKETIEIDGVTYPLVKLEITSSSHPFFTGKQKLVDTAGRVDKFLSRYGNRKKN